jgi:flagellar biosynthesis protein
MVGLLMQVDLDSRIPPQLYQAVAELLAWLHRLESGVLDEPEQPPATFEPAEPVELKDR